MIVVCTAWLLFVKNVLSSILNVFELKRIRPGVALQPSMKLSKVSMGHRRSCSRLRSRSASRRVRLLDVSLTSGSATLQKEGENVVVYVTRRTRGLSSLAPSLCPPGARDTRGRPGRVSPGGAVPFVPGTSQPFASRHCRRGVEAVGMRPA